MALFVAAANASAVWPYAAWHAPISGPIAQLSSAPLAHHHVIAAPAHVSYAAHAIHAPLAYSHAHIAAPVVVAPAHIPAHAATYKVRLIIIQ